MALQSPRFRDNQQLQDAAANKPPLRAGVTGEGVRLVQQALIELGFEMPVSVKKHGTPDGIFGTETKTTIKKFQTSEGLVPDGQAGRNTMAKLDELMPNAGDPLPPLPRSPYTHRINIRMYSIASPNVPEFHALRNAQRVYRQYGIDFSFASGMSLLIDPTTTVTLDNVNVGQCLITDSGTGEQDLLFGLARADGASPNDILVFYVNKAQTTGGATLRGCATASRGAVLVTTEGSPWTLGHEVCHVLLGSSFLPTHATTTDNLMFQNTGSISANPPQLTEAQVNQIKRSPYCIAIYLDQNSFLKSSDGLANGTRS